MAMICSAVWHNSVWEDGGVFVHQQRTLATDPFRDTCNTQEEAAVELLKANAMIAKATQQCLAPTRNAFEQLDDTKEIINKHITFENTSL